MHATASRRNRCFNPRPRAGGDASSSRHADALDACFNPRPRAGGDLDRWSTSCASMHVSIHAPARGATASDCVRACDVHCFNPRPRAGGDRSMPTMRLQLTRVSIHAPARGATPVPGIDMLDRYQFQSTPPRGGRRHAGAPMRDAVDVSIHAPARGATGMSSTLHALVTGFNPRPRAGGDVDRDRNCHTLDVFQSTPPRGGRHRDARQYVAIDDVSIHAPARGAT